MHLVDRCGRGLSGPHGDAYGLAAEVADVRAVRAQTGASSVFGVSSGGVVALHAGSAMPELGRVAVYEPALDPPGRRPASSEPFVQRYERAIAQGRTAEAVVAVLRGTRDVHLARPDDAPRLRGLRGGQPRSPALAALTAPVLLLGGSRSPRYLGEALDTLQTVLPHSERVRIPRAGHNAAANRAEGGRPDLVAPHLRTFFGAGAARPA